MSKEVTTPIRLEADSIITFRSSLISLGDIEYFSVALFKPSKATMEMLEGIERGTTFSGMELVDKWDDGTESSHTSPYAFKYVTFQPQDGNKQHTQIVFFEKPAMLPI